MGIDMRGVRVNTTKMVLASKMEAGSSASSIDCPQAAGTTVCRPITKQEGDGQAEEAKDLDDATRIRWQKMEKNPKGPFSLMLRRVRKKRRKTMVKLPLVY
jgi:hypothetical protein